MMNTVLGSEQPLIAMKYKNVTDDCLLEIIQQKEQCGVTAILAAAR
jgi:hypothetical protein